ncbi:MAG TPA: HAMP domain-containing sensor histidine kinase [Vicinamibacterales bacterium]|nr:HAMP domain-containing sensor histidine kinase [Vicinamibacterales bacterium]
MFRFRRSTDAERGTRWPSTILVFAAGLLLATATLVTLAWTAINEMRRSTALLLEQRASEVVALTSVALNRDMKGAWLSMLVPLDAGDITELPPYDLLQRSSRAFARFPYPESFIVWTAAGGPRGRTFAFNRSDRAVPWQVAEPDSQPYPVRLLQDPKALEALVAALRGDARSGQRLGLRETVFEGVPYQIIVHYLFTSPGPPELTGLVAMTVNLDWVRREYLTELLRQVAAIDGNANAMAVTVLDESGHEVASSMKERASSPVRRRTFPLLFMEPALVSSLPTDHPPIRMWTTLVQPAAASTSATTALGARLLLIASLAAAASLAALLLVVRAVRVRGELAAMKTDFVAAITHELKTPLSLIKLVGDTLEKGRYTSPDTIREYATILSQEERRLSHVVENLLTYSRLSELDPKSRAEAVDIAEVVEDAMEPFRPHLSALGFAEEMSVSHDLPQVRVDRVALAQAFGNLIDNAIKYSPERRHLAVEGTVEGKYVRVSFSDKGRGIPGDEIPRVFDRFYRGRAAGEFGSGLGLSIVRRIVEQHGGTVEISSSPGNGTTVRVSLPALSRG